MTNYVMPVFLEINSVADRIQPCLGAGLVLVATGRTGDANAAEQGATSLDDQAARQHGDIRKSREARVPSARLDRLLEVAGSGAEAQCGIGFAGRGIGGG